MIDKFLGGRYRVTTTLGSGGFSQTYIAEDTHRPGNPKCAVKHLQPANSNQSFLESARRLFNSEAETLEKLGHHDRIPRLLAYFEENQEFYLVQEFIPGQLLTHKIQPHQRWTEYQVWQFLQEILEILVFIHAQGFIHRDIKPSNIIERQQDNKLVLVDFGAVKQNWTLLLSQTSNIEIPATVGIGTPGYMPMEQARGRPRPSSDIYALGAIAVQALTGLYPMQLEEDFETGELLWRQKAQVSDALAVIITKMVRYHFKDRYESASDALAEIQQLEPLYLATEIYVNSTATQLLPTQNSSSTEITTPIVLSIENASFNSHALATKNLPIPKTTIVSPPKLKSTSAHRRPYYLTMGATIGAALVAGYVTYWQPRIKFEQTLEQLESLKATGKYSECIIRAGTTSPNPSFHTNTESILHECKLMEAKRLAAKADYQGAIALVSSIPKNTPAYKQAKPLINQWDNSILALATDKYRAGKLNEAISLAQAISSASLVYPKAQATIKQWQSTAKNNAYSAATIVHAAPNKPQPTSTVGAHKVARRLLSTSKNVSTAPKPRVYPRQASAPAKRVISKSAARVAIRPVARTSAPARQAISKPRVVSRMATRRSTVRTFRSRKVAATPPKISSKRLVSVSKTVTRTTRSRPTSYAFSNKKYLRVTKKVIAQSRRVNTRTKRVFKRVIRSQRSSTRRQKSYRWTTKTMR